jgi:hypothetical protein
LRDEFGMRDSFVLEVPRAGTKPMETEEGNGAAA